MASRKIMVIFYQNAMQQASNVIGKFRKPCIMAAERGAGESRKDSGNVRNQRKVVSSKRPLICGLCFITK